MAEQQLLKFFYKKFNSLFEYASEFESLHQETCNTYQQLLETYQQVEKLGIGAFSEEDLYAMNQNDNSLQNSHSNNSDTLEKFSHFDLFLSIPKVLTNLQTNLQFYLQSLQTKLIIQQVERYDAIVDKMLKIQYQVEVHYVKNQGYFQAFAREKYQWGIVRFISRYMELLHMICNGYLQEKLDKCQQLRSIKRKMEELGDDAGGNRAQDEDEDALSESATSGANSAADKSYFMRLIQWMETEYNRFIEFHHVERQWVNELVNLKMEDDRFEHMMHSPVAGKKKRRKIA